MATIAEMFVKLGMDASGFKSGVQAATSETKKLQDSFKKIEQAGKQISNVGKAITIGVTTPVLAAAGALVTFANSAQTSIQIERSFDAVAKSAGIMGDEMMKALQKSSRGLISNTDLMKNFNLASSLVSKQFATELPQAFEYLGKVSASTGQSMDYMLDSLVRGVGRLSPLILDNLGIQVSLNEAYEIYAQKIGKSVDELSKAEQQSAVMELTMAKLAETTAGMSDEFGTTGERIKVAMENAKDSIGRNLVPALTEAGEKLLPVIERFGSLFDVGGSLHPIIDKVSTALGKLAEGAGKAVDWLSQLDSETVEAAASFVIFLAAAGPVLTIFGKLVSGGAGVVSTLTNIGTAFGLAGKAALGGGGLVAVGVALVIAEIAYLIKWSKELEQTHNSNANSWAQINAAVNDGRITMEQYNQISADVHRGFVTLEQAVSQLPKAYVATTSSMEDNIDAVLRASTTYEEFKAGISALGIELPLMTEEIWNEAKALESVADSAESAAEATEGLSVESMEAASKLAFLAGNVDTYNNIFKQMAETRKEYEALPKWKQDREQGQELLGLLDELEGQFDNMVAKANAQSLMEAILGDGQVTRKEFQTYLDYLIETGLTTQEVANQMMKDWEATNEFQQSLRWDAEGNVYIETKEALLSAEELKAQLKGIERNIGITVSISQMGQLPTNPWQSVRALGGPVQAGTAYLVGERGEELFIPEVDGQIIPHHDIDKYTRTDSTENVMTRFGKFDEEGAEYVQNNYTLNMPTTADSSNVQMAFRMMEALG